MAGNSSLKRAKGMKPGCGMRRFPDELAAKMALLGDGRQDSGSRHENSTPKVARPHDACGGWHLYPASPSLAARPAERAPGAAAKPRKPLPPAKDTGPDAATRQAVYERDGWACVCCGQSVKDRPHSVGHRKRRSQGGSNEMTNLLTFLGWGNGLTGEQDHHWRIDRREDPHDEARGYTVRSHQDPAAIGVMIFSASGSGVTMWPTADGRWSEVPPEGAEAA